MNFFFFAPIAAHNCNSCINNSPKTTPTNTPTRVCQINNRPPATTAAALLVSLYYRHTYAFKFLGYRSYLIFIKIPLLPLSCCCLLCFAAVLLVILRHMLSFSSLALPSFGLLAFLSSSFSILPLPATLFSAYFLRSFFHSA